MESAPLNLAHFHERRADKFLRNHLFDEAFKAVEMSLLYLQDAYKNVRISKAIEVLDTQKWDLERKLRQIEIRKQQYERAKLQEILPPKKDAVSPLPPDTSTSTAQSVAKSIDLTVREFDAKFSSAQDIRFLLQKQFAKENQEPRSATFTYLDQEYESRFRSMAIKSSEEDTCIPSSMAAECNENSAEQSTSSVAALAAADWEDLPALAPLELPPFDFDPYTASVPFSVSASFTASAPSLTNITGSAESFQK